MHLTELGISFFFFAFVFTHNSQLQTASLALSRAVWIMQIRTTGTGVASEITVAPSYVELPGRHNVTFHRQPKHTGGRFWPFKVQNYESNWCQSACTHAHTLTRTHTHTHTHTRSLCLSRCLFFSASNILILQAKRATKSIILTCFIYWVLWNILNISH